MRSFRAFDRERANDAVALPVWQVWCGRFAHLTANVRAFDRERANDAVVSPVWQVWRGRFAHSTANAPTTWSPRRFGRFGAVVRSIGPRHSAGTAGTLPELTGSKPKLTFQLLRPPATRYGNPTVTPESTCLTANVPTTWSFRPFDRFGAVVSRI